MILKNVVVFYRVDRLGFGVLIKYFVTVKRQMLCLTFDIYKIKHFSYKENTFLMKILQTDLAKKPYKVKLVQKPNLADYSNHLLFANWAEDRLAVDNKFY